MQTLETLKGTYTIVNNETNLICDELLDEQQTFPTLGKLMKWLAEGYDLPCPQITYQKHNALQVANAWFAYATGMGRNDVIVYIPA